MRSFAGNAVELAGRTPEGRRRPIMAMSATAQSSLRADQVQAIEESCEIVAVDIPTIELAGGSVRCMIAGVHLDRRPTRRARVLRSRRGDRREPGDCRRQRRRRGRLTGVAYRLVDVVITAATRR